MDFHAVEQNLRESFRIIAACRQSGEVREVGGISIASAGSSFQMFNAAFLAAPVTIARGDLERRIVTAAVHFRSRGIDWSFWVCQDLVDPVVLRRLSRAFERERLFAATHLPGMAAERLLPPRRPPPPIEVRRVTGYSTRLAFCDIGADCFHVPPAWFREIFLLESVWRNGFAGYVAYLNGQPVATAATVASDGVIGVYNVATLPEHRGRGYGEAVMRFALDQARLETGCERTILQSTEQGFPLYLEMGYRTVTTVAVYASGN